MEQNSASEFKILFVCTGNICRSPLGEYLLAQKLSSFQTPISISSAGTMALIGGAVPEEIQSFALSQGVEIQNHTPRQISAGLIGNADLILTAERSHRSEVVSLVPRASAKTFTLNQFARLAIEHELAIAQGEVPAPSISNLSEVINELADFRSIAPPPESPSHDDIDDPYRKSAAVYNQAGESIARAVDATAKIFATYSR